MVSGTCATLRGRRRSYPVLGFQPVLVVMPVHSPSLLVERIGQLLNACSDVISRRFGA